MKQRTSTRTIKLSKAFRTVDEETRRALAEQRLLALEHDNYNEQEVTGEAPDENYASDDSEAPKKKRAKKDSSGAKSGGNSRALLWLNRAPKNLERVLMDNGLSPDLHYVLQVPPSNADAEEPQSESEEDAAVPVVPAVAAVVAPEKITYAQLCRGDGFRSDSAHYYSVAARFPTNTSSNTSTRAKLPRARQFCAVCGYLGDYACTRCGARSCSLRCQSSHQETRCLNQSL